MFTNCLEDISTIVYEGEDLGYLIKWSTFDRV